MNPSMMWAQTALKSLGYTPGAIDGITGPATGSALAQAILDGKVDVLQPEWVAFKKDIKLNQPTRRTINDVYGTPKYKDGPKKGAITILNPTEWHKNFTEIELQASDDGKVYVWDDTGNVWDAGTLLADGQIVTSKGGTPDIIVGGTGATDYEKLSDKLDADKLACKDLTVALSADTGSAATDPDWVAAYYMSASPVSGADQVVKSVTIAGDGAITLTLAAASTAEAVYRICAILD